MGKYKQGNGWRRLLLPEALWNTRNKILHQEADKDVNQAVEELKQESEKLLGIQPFSVTYKKANPPSGTKNDYMSLSIYHWPNPNTPDGLPYITRDGDVNPEVEEYDGIQIIRMVKSVDTLGLTYTLTGDEKYAEKANEFLYTWFIDPATRMNPNMLFAQYIPGKGGFDSPARYPAVYVPGINGEGVFVAFGGVIEGCILPIFTDSIGLLKKSSTWTEKLNSGLQQWFKDFLHWMLESQHGKDEAGTLNNHGSWYCTQVVSYSIFCGEYEIARRLLTENTIERIAMQIEPDGSQPTELERATPFTYVVFGLESFVNLAIFAEKIGIDLWNYETKDGRGIRKAIDWVFPYLNGEKQWEYRQNGPLEFGKMVSILYEASRAYKDSKYWEVAEKMKNRPSDFYSRILYPFNK